MLINIVRSDILYNVFILAYLKELVPNRFRYRVRPKVVLYRVIIIDLKNLLS
jgi:hypothetical protein